MTSAAVVVRVQGHVGFCALLRRARARTHVHSRKCVRQHILLDSSLCTHRQGAVEVGPVTIVNVDGRCEIFLNPSPCRDTLLQLHDATAAVQ